MFLQTIFLVDIPRAFRCRVAAFNFLMRSITITRGDGRRTLFHDDGHYDRRTPGLKEEVTRSGWKVLSFCGMPHYIHLFLQNPEPDLARGMQHWLSGYANQLVYTTKSARGQFVSGTVECLPFLGPCDMRV